MGVPDKEKTGSGHVDYGLIAAIHAALSTPEAGARAAN